MSARVNVALIVTPAPDATTKPTHAPRHVLAGHRLGVGGHALRRLAAARALDGRPLEQPRPTLWRWRPMRRRGQRRRVLTERAGPASRRGLTPGSSLAIG